MKSLTFGARNIAHVAIKVDNLKLSCKFYEVVLGLKVGKRPPFGYPGAWLGGLDGIAIIHLYGGDRGVDPIGNPYMESGAVDHVSISCDGYKKIISVLDLIGLPRREFDVPNTNLRQVFVYDPNGVLLELTFDRDREPDVINVNIPDNLRYIANVSFFDRDVTRTALFSLS